MTSDKWLAQFRDDLEHALDAPTRGDIRTLLREYDRMRTALASLGNADDAYQASYKTMMSSPVHDALEESGNTSRLERQREEAITLCVELGRSLKASNVRQS